MAAFLCDNVPRMSTIGATVWIRGEVRSSTDLEISGHVEGPITCEGAAVTIAAPADIRGDVIARDITVFGRMSGRLIATDVVDVRPTATLTGQVIARRFILHDGASFQGRVEPQHLETAVRLAKYQQRKDAEALAASAVAQTG